MINVLFAAIPDRWERYEPHLRKAFEQAGLSVHLGTDIPADQVDYMVYAPNGPVDDFTRYPRLKAVLCLWAGVENVVTNPTLNVPLCRMVDGGLQDGMVEWVTGHVLRHHLGMDVHIHGQDGVWRKEIPPLAKDRHVTILGLGELGAACAQALAALKFSTHGWSRTPKTIENVTCHNDLETALQGSEILVLLLPLTPQTENILNAQTLSLLPKGAVIINPGRGPMIDDDALVDALDRDAIGHATLDVFRQEPLPPDHPFWDHPKITVTPHIASETRISTASEVIAQNIARAQNGEPLLHVVDRQAGY